MHNPKEIKSLCATNKVDLDLHRKLYFPWIIGIICTFFVTITVIHTPLTSKNPN